jgi:hypothetical protein
MDLVQRYVGRDRFTQIVAALLLVNAVIQLAITISKRLHKNKPTRLLTQDIEEPASSTRHQIKKIARKPGGMKPDVHRYRSH